MKQVYRVWIWRPSGEWYELVREDALAIFVDNLYSNYPDALCTAVPT